jgi:hypothetical protein
MKAFLLLALVALAAFATVAHCGDVVVTYNGKYRLESEYSHKWAVVDTGSSGNPLRFSTTNATAGSVLTLTGTNSPFITNNSAICSTSLPAVLNGGAVGRWCVPIYNRVGYTAGYAFTFCNSFVNNPKWVFSKRNDLARATPGCYLWQTDPISIYNVDTGYYCGVTDTTDIMRCDFATLDDSVTVFNIIYENNLNQWPTL